MRTIALALVVAASLGASCPPPVQQGLKACGQQVAQSAIDQLVPTVKTVIETGAKSWQDQLKGLGTALGGAVVNCAVNQWLASRTPAAGGPFTAAADPAAGGPSTAAADPAVVRGRSWLQDQNLPQ